MIRRQLQSGVSLVEALVALVVMAIGAVAVVSLQLSVRGSSDIAKQRAEAVRLAQEVVEDWRGFSSFNALATKRDWTDLVSTAAGTPTPLAGSNVTFLREVTVVERGAANDDPLSKTVHVKVTWGDRTGSPQEVHLNTLIGGVLPELGGSLSITGSSSLVTNPAGRHPTIPRAAIDMGDGTSRFTPPGGGPNVWVFNNTIGIITNVCTSMSTPIASCSDFNARLLTGFIRFALGAAEPTSAVAEAPTDASLDFAVKLAAVPLDPPSDLACYADRQSSHIEYFCAVPIDATGTGPWGDRSLWFSTPSGLSWATSSSDSGTTQLRACRYTPVRSCHPAVGDDIWGTPGLTASCTGTSPTPKRKMTNADHPKVYQGVLQNLVNQNYLVMRAGNGTSAFVCPADDSSTPNLNGNTWEQPPPGS